MATDRLGLLGSRPRGNDGGIASGLDSADEVGRRYPWRRVHRGTPGREVDRRGDLVQPAELVT